MVAIIRTNPTRALTMVEPVYPDVFDEIEEMIRDFEPITFDTVESLPLDMYESKDALVLRVEVPGIKREDIDVSLQGDYLTIKADSKQEDLPEGATSYICERYAGQFSRTVGLPFPVDADKISTTFESGLL